MRANFCFFGWLHLGNLTPGPKRSVGAGEFLSFHQDVLLLCDVARTCFLQGCERLKRNNKHVKASPEIIFWFQVADGEGNSIICLPISENGKNGKRNIQAKEATAIALRFLPFLYQDIKVYLGILGLSSWYKPKQQKSILSPFRNASCYVVS